MSEAGAGGSAGESKSAGGGGGSGGKKKSSSGGDAIRVVVQRCASARLLLDNASEWGEIGPGIVVYVSFKKACTPEMLPKLCKLVLQTKLLAGPDGGKPVSVLERAGSVMVVPQACLSGKVKGKQVQYHGQIAKATGEELYEGLKKLLPETAASLGGEEMVFCFGTYGNRQGLQLMSDGPMTHLIEL